MRAKRVAAWIGLGLALIVGCSDEGNEQKEGAAAAGRPELLSADAPSMHYVTLSFSAPVGSSRMT